LYNRHYYHNKKARPTKWLNSRLFLILFAPILFFFLIYSIDLLIYRGKIYPSVITMGQEIGGLRKNEAYQILQPVIKNTLNNPILINHEEGKLSIVPQDDIGAVIDIDKLTNEAYSIGRRGTFFFRIKERILLIRKNYHLSPLIRVEENEFKSLYNHLQAKLERPSRDASLASDRVIPAQIGIVINEEQLLKDIENGVIEITSSNIPITIDLPVYHQLPEISTMEILTSIGVFETISTYETSLLGKEENTFYNIQKAAEQINGVIIKPGEIFSFNQIIGPADKEDGYKESTIIANGQFVNGYGGGVCQVSTTLYNAVLLANLQIMERYNHSIYGEVTNYVPLGRDAAIFYGYKDLKFKNSLDQLIVIFSEVKSDSLVVTIRGEKGLDKNVRIITQDLKTYDYDVIEIKQEGTRSANDVNNVIQEGVPGYSIKTYRLIIDNSGERMELLSEDRYVSVPKKILFD